MKSPSINRVLLLASVILVITQCVSSISAQTVLFNADFSNTTGDNAWTQSINTNGSFTVGGIAVNNQYPSYANNALFALESPVIDLTGYGNLTLDLDHFYKTQPGRDGIQLQYRINGGPWSVLGTAASGFYNDTDVDGIANNTDGWSGDNTPTGGDAFTNAPTLNLSAFDTNFNNAANIQIRVVFGSDNIGDILTDNNGAAIDNVIIRGLPATNCIDATLYTESFETGFGRWSQTTADNFDWSIGSGNTPTNNTGPSTASDGNQYAYIEASNSSTGSVARLISDCIDLTNYTSALFEFDYHMHGNNGSLNLDISTNGGGSWSNLFSRNGEQQADETSPWLTETISLNAYLGSVVYFRFSATDGTGNNNRSDTAIDAISITGINGPTPDISLSGNSVIISDGDAIPTLADNTNFGTTTVGAPISKIFRISNTGVADLILAGTPTIIAAGTPGFNYFTITQSPATTIIPGGNTTFEITYNPLLTGIHNAEVLIASNDPDENPFNFVISGTTLDVEPEIVLSGDGIEISNNDITPSLTDNTNFGSVELGYSVTKTFVIENEGINDLLLTGGSPYIDIVGAGASRFQVSLIPNNTIAGGNFVTFQIKYTPDALITHPATVRIQNNDTDEGTFLFNIQGTGIVNNNLDYTIYYENFDTDDGNWTPSSTSGSIWRYGSNNVEAGAEGDYWYTDNYNNYANNTRTYVTSPPISLSGYSNVRFLLDMRINTNADRDDGMQVQYRLNGAGVWSTLGDNTDTSNWYNDAEVRAIGINENGWSGDNESDLNVPGRSDFTQQFVDLPSNTIGQSIEFRIYFASDGGTTDDGANFDNVFLIGTQDNPDPDPVIAPGAVTPNMSLWLKANDIDAVSSGDLLNIWQDRARDNDAFTAELAPPTYHNSAAINANYNPLVEFDTSANQVLKGKGGFDTSDYWVVLRTPQLNESGVIEGVLSGRVERGAFANDGTGLWVNPGSERFNNQDNLVSHMIGATPQNTSAADGSNYGRAYVSTADEMNSELIILNVKASSDGLTSEIYKNGVRIDNYTGTYSVSGNDMPYSEVTNSQFNLGVGRITLVGHAFQSFFEGQITEFISYRLPNSLFDQKRIQSYLAIKNGITLHSVTSDPTNDDANPGDENYVDSAGNIIWNAVNNSGFTHDIAGIGRDDASGLNQKQSISSHIDGAITMGIETIYDTNSDHINSASATIDDKNFLMWGNNNASLSAASPIAVDMSLNIPGLSTNVNFISINRTWKVVETGDLSTVKVSLEESLLSATITPPGNFFMFISDSPTFDPTSDYRIMTSNGSKLETTYDFTGEKYITFGYAPEYIYERSITFDGTRDYMDADDVADLTGPFTISTWVKRGANANNSDIISKRNIGPYTEGYALLLNNARRPRIVWKNAAGTTEALNSSIVLPQDEWHHVAVIYDGNRVTFYIDGIEDTSAVRNAPASSNQHFLVAAANYQSPTRFFDGTIDEVRVWNQALSQEQLQFIMNQEIEKFTDDSVNGKIIPQNISKNEVASIPWADLEMYLPMNKYTFTNVKDESDNNYVAAIKNLQTVDFQTAPLPYVSTADGVWANTNTWTNGDTQALPGAPSIVDGTQTIDWNIVQTAHNVSTASNNTVLALDVNTAELTIGNDSKIEVSHYLRLDGIMDLVGESQLVQTENSDLAATSSGRLERDQQGTSDTYSYNIWSSPVGPINITDINEAHTVASIMNDGTDENNPQSLNFSTGYNGANSTPKTVSAYWLYTYRNDPADTYSAWEQIGPYGTLETGDGFTMKGPGSGAVTDPQNYVFIGKPNNGTDATSIDKTINAGNDYLMGNPFPSALDANKFINDNPHLTGTLSFWEHWGGGNHFLADYEAGYALYTLSGGTPAVSHPAQNTSGASTNTPTQFIAVGQGFFVRGATTGTTSFNNTQRVFAKEASSGSFFFNGQNQQTESTLNAEDEIVKHEDLREKFRIGFDSPSAYHRQLLMTIDENTTFGYDRAYDAVIDNHPQEDMMWMLDDEKAIILGVPSIENDRKFPLRIGLPMDGEISIGVDALENVNTDNTTVYLFDALQDTYTDITIDQKFTLTLEAGTYLDRFYIVLEKTAEAEEETEDTAEETDEQEEEDQDIEVVDTETIDDAEQSDNLSVYFNSQSHNIIINKRVDYDVQSVQLFTMLGQLIKEWTPESETTRVELPVQDVSTGAYIIKVQKLQTTHTQKLIIH
ncbi:choice-of-anchor D domain-containing protein [Dokdonia sp. PRO95]|uniref:choice-of-anchor D domain-containing protein n=1 Tax=Dokdonia sp. PRO95 TaxID=1239415 RepID=UPI0009DF7AA7|nr:choice-of-anchor D domain-containing protein [Dokdonia sp. PRO95]